MAPKPLSPIEALAKRQVKPITPVKTGVVKQAAPPPINPFLPSTTVPSTGAASNVPENKPFVGPTLDPDVIQQRSKLKAQEIQALQAGIDPAIVKSIVAGEGDPNRGFLGPARWLGNVIKNIYDVDLVKGEGEFQPFVKIANFDPIKGDREFKPVKATGKAAATVGTKVLLAASPAIDKLDFGRRFVTSTLNEVGDLLGQGRKPVRSSSKSAEPRIPPSPVGVMLLRTLVVNGPIGPLNKPSRASAIAFPATLVKRSVPGTTARNGPGPPSAASGFVMRKPPRTPRMS